MYLKKSIIVVLGILTASGQAGIKPAQLFTDNMVIQRETRAPIWGWADHGYHLGDKESCVKFTLWEKVNHVPFIIVAPGVTKPGSICKRPIGLIDIYPTLVELAGLPARKDLDGKSLVPRLKDPRRQWLPANEK